MKDDPYELNDISENNPEIVQSLLLKMTDWQKEANAKLPRNNTKYDPNKPATHTGSNAYSIAIKHRQQAEERLKNNIK